MPTKHGLDERVACWRERLGDAIGRGLDSGGGVELFWEERHDLVVILGSDGAERVTTTSHRGLALRRVGGAMLVRADPDGLEPSRMTGSLAEAGPAEPAGTDDGPGCRVANGHLADLLEAASRACPTAAFVARWIGFDQSVVVARTGGRLVDDRRAGRRVRLDGRLGRDGVRAAAAGDAVLPGDERRTAEVLRALADRVAARLQARVRAASMISGEFPVVFAPGVGGILAHELVGHAIEADTVLRRGSWLASLEPGTRVAIEELSILDDPRRGRGAWRIDDEGVPARPTALVRDGRLVQPLTDRATARRARLTLTGNGRCGSYRDPVRPRMGCTFVAAGRATPEEAFAGIVDGLYVRRMEAAHVDAASGRAVFRVSDADRIVNARIERPLSPFVMCVDAPHALPTVERIAGDLEFDTCIGTCLRDGQAIAASVGAPTFRIPLVTAVFTESAA